MLNFLPKGQKVYFPRFVFTLLRTERKNRNEVVFRCSPILNKFDIQQYLQKLYGLKILNIETITYPAKQTRTGNLIERQPAWKKAFVTLDHDFEFPVHKPVERPSIRAKDGSTS
jgi:large subunit ribosomal protein L23